jgi:branched-chain amino acid aminotransferase
MTFETEKWKTSPEIKRRMDAIKEGRAEDKYGWMVKV